MTKKVFLGGTVNGSTWRETLIPQLKIDYFNPVVADWNEAAQEEEIRQRQICDFVLYVITKQMLGFYAIAEVVEDSNKRPDKTIFCYLEEGFGQHQIKSLKATARLVKENGAQVFTSLGEVANYLNKTQENITDQSLVISPSKERQCNPITLAKRYINYLCGKEEVENVNLVEISVRRRDG